MPSKYNLTVELSKQTARDLSSSPGKYMSFLETAANNYKYSFADQVLGMIFAVTVFRNCEPSASS